MRLLILGLLLLSPSIQADTPPARAINSQTYNGAGTQAITADSPGNAGNNRLHTATPDTTISSTTLGALNAVITLPMSGLQSAGVQLAAGTFIGTISAFVSVDGGVNYTPSMFYNPTNQSTSAVYTFTSANTATTLGLVGLPGLSTFQVKVTGYTSGSMTATMRAAFSSGSSPTATISAAFGTISNTYPAIVSGVVTQVVAANTNRKYLAIANNGNQTMHCQYGSLTGLTATTGLPFASATYYEFKGDNLFTGPVFCIVAGTIAVTVAEGTP